MNKDIIRTLFTLEYPLDMGDWQQFFSEKGLFHSYYFEEEEEEGVEWKYTLYGVQDQLEKEAEKLLKLLDKFIDDKSLTAEAKQKIIKIKEKDEAVNTETGNQ